MPIPLLLPLDWPELTARLAVALLVGGIIGFERELRKKAAGLRTYMLVSFGSAVLVLIPIQLNLVQPNGEVIDRTLQGIISGIGFIGGGMILHSNREDEPDGTVQGLTSAAAVWMTSALGIAAGCGLWQLALVSAGIAFLILRFLKWLERL